MKRTLKVAVEDCIFNNFVIELYDWRLPEKTGDERCVWYDVMISKLREYYLGQCPDNDKRRELILNELEHVERDVWEDTIWGNGEFWRAEWERPGKVDDIIDKVHDLYNDLIDKVLEIVATEISGVKKPRNTQVSVSQ